MLEMLYQHTRWNGDPEDSREHSQMVVLVFVYKLMISRLIISLDHSKLTNRQSLFHEAHSMWENNTDGHRRAPMLDRMNLVLFV